MKIKLNKTTSTGKELWLEVTNITEITSGPTTEFIGASSFDVSKSGSNVAICNWKVVDVNNTIIIPPPSGTLQFVHGSLPAGLYSQWDKTEEQFGTLLVQSLSAILESNLIG
jgi:hypothetical protein